MSQTNHNECWIPASDPPNTKRRIIIWTRKPWLSKTIIELISRHLDTGGAWHDPKERVWFHSDGSIADDVTHWMEMPGKPKPERIAGAVNLKGAKFPNEVDDL